jgi:hypothetical protein
MELSMRVIFMLGLLALAACGGGSTEGVEQIQGIPDVPNSAPWFMSMFSYVLAQFPGVNTWFAASMMFVMAILRALAELLHFIAARTATKTDDQIAEALTKILDWAGAIIGWFGLGAPKVRR